MAITSISGFNVQKPDKSKYMVAQNNVNFGAGAINKSEADNFDIINGVKVNKASSAAAKVAGGLLMASGVAVAAANRKNIIKFVNNLKKGKVAVVVDTLKKGSAKAADGVKDAALKGTGKFKEKAGKLYNKAANWIAGVWTKVKNFFKGIFAKKQSTGKTEKTGFFSKVTGFIKKGWVATKNFFKNTYKTVKNHFVKENTVQAQKTVFGNGLSPEWEKAKKAGIVESFKNVATNPSGLTKQEKRSELAKRFGAMNVH